MYAQVTPKSSIATLAKSPKVTPDGTPVKPTMAQQLADLGSKLPPSTKDLWMPILILVINFATIGLGIYRLHKVRETQCQFRLMQAQWSYHWYPLILRPLAGIYWLHNTSSVALFPSS